MRSGLIITLAALAVGGVWDREANAMDTRTVYEFSAKKMDGSVARLEAYRGKALLIVNTASKCGFTPQYKSLQALYDRYKDRGLEVLGFPANNFLGQEPGTDEEIREFCSLKYQVTFPLFSKISVKGDDIHPLFKYLTQETDFKGDVSWNFNKFLVDTEGRVVARFGTRTDPQDKEIIQKIESILTQKS